VVNLKKKNIGSAAIWKILEIGGTQLVSFLFQIILARLLFPEIFGLYAKVAIFINLFNVIIANSFNPGLIQKQKVDELDYSTAFWATVLLGLVGYGFIFSLAPVIAFWFDQPLLIFLLRVYGINLLISGFTTTHYAIIARSLTFNLSFKSNLLSIVIAGVIGIFLAAFSFGIWSLIAFALINHLVYGVMVVFFTKWKPQFSFSLTRCKSLIGFSNHIVKAIFINTVYANLVRLAIGYKSDVNLAYFNKAESFLLLLVAKIDHTIHGVLFPTLSEFQNDPIRLKKLIKKAIKISTYLVFPIVMGMFLIARPLVIVVLTYRWLAVIPIIQILAFDFALWPIHSVNIQAMKAIGRSDLYAKNVLIDKVIALCSVVIGLRFGLIGVAFAFVFASVLSLFIYSKPSKQFINYKLSEQLKDVLPNGVITLVMGLFVFFAGYFITADVIRLIVQIVVGVVSYVVLSQKFKNEAYVYLVYFIEASLASREQVKNEKLSKNRSKLLK